MDGYTGDDMNYYLTNKGGPKMVPQILGSSSAGISPHFWRGWTHPAGAYVVLWSTRPVVDVPGGGRPPSHADYRILSVWTTLPARIGH